MMNKYPKLACVALALAGLMGAASGDDESVQSGQQVFERRCRTCHGGKRADLPIGPSLTGIIGTKAGTQPSGVHSRAAIDSGIVWDRESLRRFLSEPPRDPPAPGPLMRTRVEDPKELESLLDYLESLR